MLKVLDKLDVSDLPDPSRLFLDYVSAPSRGVPPYLHGLSAGADFWRSRADNARRGDGGEVAAWAAVVDEMEALGRRLGVRDDVLAKLRPEGGEEALFVVTGQQPGALGGPLHTVYKIATAVALAADIEEKLSRPCIPLYWCGADDTDFQEIRDVLLLSGELTPISSSLPQDAHAAGMPIGDIATGPSERLWEGVAPFVAGLAGYPFVESAVTGSLGRASDQAELASAILVALFGGAFAVVDGRSQAVRRCAAPLFTRYLEEEEKLKAAIASEGARLEAAGYHAQLTVGADSGVFLLENGRRKTVAADQRDALLDAARRGAARCSPGVVVRNLVQDRTFRPVAVILGPGEIAYRAQIGFLYERLGVPRPSDVPRMGATLVPPGLASLCGGAAGTDVKTLVQDPPAFARSIYGQAVPSQVRKSLDDMNTELGKSIGKFRRQIERSLGGKALSKIQSRLDDVERRLDNVAKAAIEAGRIEALERWPFLAELERIMRPQGRPQERSLSGLQPFLFSGDGAGHLLIDAASAYVHELLDGRATHIVYSAEP